MYSNCSPLPYVRNYREADEVFNKTKRPRSTTKWQDHQRPLGSTRQWHYRIEKYAGYFDVCLYHTVMARYYEPDSNGERRCYAGHGSQTSSSFVSNVLGLGKRPKYCTTDGRTVYMPVALRNMPGSQFSVDAVFKGALLDVSMSSHTPLYKLVSSEGDRATRRLVKKRMEPLLTLAAMRLHELENTVPANWNVSGAFSSGNVLYSHRTSIRNIVDAVLYDTEFRPQDIDNFMDLTKAVYEKRISDLAEQQGRIGWKTPHTAVFARDLEQRVTEKQLMSSLWAHVSKNGALSQRSATQPYPQFPEPDQITWSNVVSYEK